MRVLVEVNWLKLKLMQVKSSENPQWGQVRVRGQDAEVGRCRLSAPASAPPQRHRRLVETKLGNGRLADPTNTSADLLNWFSPWCPTCCPSPCLYRPFHVDRSCAPGKAFPSDAKLISTSWVAGQGEGEGLPDDLKMMVMLMTAVMMLMIIVMMIMNKPGTTEDKMLCKKRMVRFSFSF